MSYTDKYHNEKVLQIISIYDEWNRLGVPNTVIYREHIKCKFFISWSTFCGYLKKSENVKIKVNNQKQLALFE